MSTVGWALLPLGILAWEILGRILGPFDDRQDALCGAVSEAGCDASVVDSTVTCAEREGGTSQYPGEWKSCKWVSLTELCVGGGIGTPTRRWASSSRRCSSDQVDRH